MGIGQSVSSPPARGLGEHCKLPQRGLGLSPAAKRFSCILEAPDSLSWNLFGPSSGEAAPPLSLLKSVFASAPDRTTCKSTALALIKRWVRGGLRLTRYPLFTPPPLRQRSIVMRVSVCLCLSFCPRPYFRNYMSNLHQMFCARYDVTCGRGRGSVLLWRRYFSTPP